MLPKSDIENQTGDLIWVKNTKNGLIFQIDEIEFEAIYDKVVFKKATDKEVEEKLAVKMKVTEIQNQNETAELIKALQKKVEELEKNSKK
jgi:hypothetical protein